MARRLIDLGALIGLLSLTAVTKLAVCALALGLLVALVYGCFRVAVWWPTLFGIEGDWYAGLAFGTAVLMVWWVKVFEWNPLIGELLSWTGRRLVPVTNRIDAIRRSRWG